MNYDHEAIHEAYPDERLEIIDGKGIFKANTSCSESFSVDQSLVDAARVELNKLNYKNPSLLRLHWSRLRWLRLKLTDSRLGLKLTE